MKNTAAKLIVTLFAVLAAFSACAADTIEVTVQVTKGDNLVAKTDLVTQNGVAAPVSMMTETAYRARAAKAADGTITVTPGTVSTGFMATVVPVLLKNGCIRLQISMSNSELRGLEPLTTLDGMEVDMPKVTPGFVLTNDIVLDQGKTLLLYSDGNGYRVQVTASEI